MLGKSFDPGWLIMLSRERIFMTLVVLAVGAAIWAVLPPRGRSAAACDATDAECLRKVAYNLVLDGFLDSDPKSFVTNGPLAHLFATEPTESRIKTLAWFLDASLDRDDSRLVKGAFRDSFLYDDYTLPDLRNAVETFGNGLSDDIPVDEYLHGAFTSLLRQDPATVAATIDLWEENIRYVERESPDASDMIVIWTAIHDVPRFLRVSASGHRRAVERISDETILFEIAAYHCAAGRRADGLAVLAALKQSSYYSTGNNRQPGWAAINMLIPLPDCEGEGAALAFVEKTVRAEGEELLTDYLLSNDGQRISSGILLLHVLATKVSNTIAVWYVEQDRWDDAKAFQTAYNPSMLARRQFPDKPWIASMAERDDLSWKEFLDANASRKIESPVPELQFEFIADEISATTAPQGMEAYHIDLALLTTEAAWPSKEAMTAAQKLYAMINRQDPYAIGYLAGKLTLARLERKIGCVVPGDLLTAARDAVDRDDFALSDRIDILLPLIRLDQTPAGPVPDGGYDCLIRFR
jgi:hypothetical protein